MIHTPTAISIFVCLSMVQLMAVFMSLRCVFFSSRRRHTIFDCDWSSDVCSSDLLPQPIFGLCAVFNFATIVSIDFGIRSVPLQITATCPTSENDSQENRRAKADLSAERDRKSVV